MESQRLIPELCRLCKRYGHTRLMAELIAEGVKSETKEDVVLLDFANDSPHVVKTALQEFDGLIIGSPTINADAVEPVWRALSYVSAITAKGKLAAVFAIMAERRSGRVIRKLANACAWHWFSRD